LFWEDKGQQEPTLLSENLLDLKKETNTKILFKVKDFWDQTNSEGKWRTWKKMDYREDSPLKDKAQALVTVLEQKKILVTGGMTNLNGATILQAPSLSRR